MVHLRSDWYLTGGDRVSKRCCGYITSGKIPTGIFVASYYYRP